MNERIFDKCRTFFERSKFGKISIVIVSVVIACYFLIPIVLNRAAGSLIRNDQVVRADVIVALGGDKRCGREKRAVELYRQRIADKVIVSGVQYAWGIHTGEAAKRYVIRLGVPESDVLIIRDTWNTRAEARVLDSLMREHGWRSAIIVTSPFHSRRALYTVEKISPDLTFYSSPVTAQAPEWQPVDWWKRRSDAFLTTREFISWINTLVNGWQ
jgi:uncharacterized SAM-binding protein YcdF (DUF218 family)